jgi:hypothetical protein
MRSEERDEGDEREIVQIQRAADPNELSPKVDAVSQAAAAAAAVSASVAVGAADAGAAAGAEAVAAAGLELEPALEPAAAIGSTAAARA